MKYTINLIFAGFFQFKTLRNVRHIKVEIRKFCIFYITINCLLPKVAGKLKCSNLTLKVSSGNEYSVQLFISSGRSAIARIAIVDAFWDKFN